MVMMMGDGIHRQLYCDEATFGVSEYGFVFTVC